MERMSVADEVIARYKAETPTDVRFFSKKGQSLKEVAETQQELLAEVQQAGENAKG